MNKVALDQFIFNFSPASEASNLGSPVLPGAGVCLWCGGGFEKRKAGKPQRFCKSKCRNSYKRKKYWQKHAPQNISNRIKSFKCVICGCGWSNLWMWKKKWGNRKICLNKRCEKKLHAINSAKHHAKWNPQKEKRCDWCGNLFSGRVLFCSSFCSSKNWNFVKKLQNPSSCETCGADITFQKHKKRFCSNSCCLKKWRSRKSISQKIADRIRGRIADAIRKYKYAKKKSSSKELLGCDYDFAKNHIESKFRPGMTWENYGLRGWQIDHIVPCASFDLTDLEQQKKCFHYTNLQPLWWKENIQKSDRLDWSPAGL